MNSRLRRQRREVIEAKHADWPVTGRAPDLLQDQSSDLSYWLSERIDSRMQAREAAEQIKEQR